MQMMLPIKKYNEKNKTKTKTITWCPWDLILFNIPHLSEAACAIQCDRLESQSQYQLENNTLQVQVTDLEEMAYTLN